MTEVDLQEKLAFEFPDAHEMRDKHHEFQMKMAVVAKKFAYEYLNKHLQDFKSTLELHGHVVLTISPSQFKVPFTEVPESCRKAFTELVTQQIEAFLESRKYVVDREVLDDPNPFNFGFVYQLKVGT
jgi:hypothetical protein